MKTNELQTEAPVFTIIERLFKCGITPTRQRMEIANILLQRPQHVSAEQMLSLLNKQQGKASKATVYNTLGLFARKGLVREIIVDPSRVFYDSNTTEHHHFYNMDTGVLSDIEDDQIHIDHLPALPQGTVAERVDIIYRIRNIDILQ